jgi:guanylate kinase
MSRAPSQPSESAPARPAPADSSPPVLFVLSAPSGAGKTTLCNQVLKTRPNLTRAITCTTRPARPSEREGVDYFFLEAGDFLKRVQAGNFLEHATVYGNSYGTLKSEVLAKLRSGRDVLLNIDVQGAAAIRAAAEEDPELRRALVTVFLAAPSLGVLEKRLRKRGQDPPAAIQKRLGVARQELAQAKNFDYVIISSTVVEDLRRMEAVIDAEKMKQARVPLPVYE